MALILGQSVQGGCQARLGHAVLNNFSRLIRFVFHKALIQGQPDKMVLVATIVNDQIVCNGIKPGYNRFSFEIENIGLIYQQKGEYDKSIAYFGDALRLHKQTGNQMGAATGMVNIGIIYRKTGELEKAM